LTIISFHGILQYASEVPDMKSAFIRKMRKANGLSMADVAKKLGMTRQTYTLIEEGTRELSLSEAMALAAALGLEFDDFLKEKEPRAITAEVTYSQTPKAVVADEDIRISIPAQHVEKFKQVFLYLLSKVGGLPNVGETVLYKLLYFIDFDYYELYETQLMGLSYIRNHHGPTPLLFKKVIDQLIGEKAIEKVKSEFYRYPQTKYLINPRLKVDLSGLTAQELAHINWEMDRLAGQSAAQLSEFSHKDVPWITTESGTLIEYEAVFYRLPETSVRTYDERD
jgi:transcriptional regulator with XRE-family HTH domain/uncharacterized phage-associated protein